MNQHQIKPMHRCALKKTTRGLPTLAPNVSRWMRFKRWMRTMSLLDEMNRNCIHFFAATSEMRSEFYRHAKSRDRYVIHPFSKLSHLLRLLFFFSWGAQLWGIPVYYSMSLNIEVSMNIVVVYIMAAIQTISVISFFFIGYVKNKTKTIIIEHKNICRHYLRTYFIPDFIAVMGPVVHTFVPLEVEDDGKFNIEFCYRYAVVLCYVIRLRSMKQTTVEILLVSGFSESLSFLLDHFCTMALIIHLMSSLVISIPWMLYDEYPEESWFKQANINNVTEAGITAVYIHSLLMTCCYYFGVSHGGYQITVPSEEITLFLVSLVGRISTLYMIAHLLRVFGLANVSESRYENVMSMLKEYIKSKDLPPHMRTKLIEYCKYKLQGHYISETEMFKTLSDHIRTELLLHRAKNTLAKIPVLLMLPKEQLGTLIADLQIKLYSPGDRIVVKGEQIEDIYIIKCGTVAVYHSDIELCHFEDGDTFGDTIYILPDYFYFRFTYVATDYTELYTLHKEKFKQLLMHDDIRKHFEVKCHAKIRKLEDLRDNISQGNDILSELRGRRVLESSKLKPLYNPE